jgi:plasmid stabilization system protein ParE
MKFVLRYRPEVVADLDAARCWYEERSAGLGSGFIVECSESLARIQRNPEWVGVDAYGVRSLRIHRFPYVIHYRIEGEMIVVFAIMFGGRDPSAWQGRI